MLPRGCELSAAHPLDEVVEGELSGGRIQEKRRISFAPRPAQIAR